MDNMDKHRVLLTPTNNGKKYHLSPSSPSSSSPFQQIQKRRRRRQSPYTNKHNKKLNVNNKSPIDRLMSRFHKNTSPYKTSIPIKTIKRWKNSNSSSNNNNNRIKVDKSPPSSPPLHASTIKNNVILSYNEQEMYCTSPSSLTKNTTRSQSPLPPSLKGPTSPTGPGVIFGSNVKIRRNNTYEENGIDALHERIKLATYSTRKENEDMFKHKLDRLKERLINTPFPTIKQDIAREPLFPEYSLRLHHLDSNYLKLLNVERNKKVNTLRRKHNTILLRQIFNYWNRQKNIANKVKLFLADRKEVFVHEAFYAWIKFKKRMQRERRYTFAILRTKSKKYKFHRETHLKISLFNILVDNVYYMKQQYIKAETFYIEKVCKHKCKVSLRILKKYSDRKKRKRVLKEKIIWFRNQSLKYKMHIAWLNYLYQRKFLKYYMNKLILRFKHKELFSGWDAWREYTDWHSEVSIYNPA